MRTFARKHGFDGIELQIFQDIEDTYLEDDMIQGIHLSFYNCWMDFWQNMQRRTGNGSDIHEKQYHGDDYRLEKNH